MSRRPGLRRWLGGALCAALGLTGAVIAAEPANAYEHLVVGNCDPIRWTSPPRIIWHTTEWQAGGGGPFTGDLYSALVSVADEFNHMGATSARVRYLDITSDPFTFGAWYQDPTPTIHLGFTNNANVAEGATTAQPQVDANCEYDEMHIRFQDVNTQAWRFGLPDTYYTAQETDAAGAMYFRTAFLHELLHAFGLQHTRDDYAFMNFREFPWANRTGGNGVRPLPDDVAAMRYLYPAAGVRSEVATLTTWFDTNRVSAVGPGAAMQIGLCAPSLGNQFSASPFSDISATCGTGGPNAGSTSVCPDDLLYTRFALANYSTESVHVDVRLWLSTDEVFTLSDKVSPTHPTADVTRANSALQSHNWRVPAGLIAGTRYFVIAQVAGTTATGAPVDDWIPLRGTVTARAVC
jgi:hypothetical protein